MNPIFGTKSNSEIMKNSQIYSEDKGIMIEGNEMGIVAHQILETFNSGLSYINALLEFQYFKETTYKVTENSGTYSLSEYTPQNVTGENLMAKQQMSGAIYNDPNTTYPYSSFTISGFFDSEVYSQMNTSMRSLFVNYYHSSDYNDTENWNKTASLTGLTETTATFKYTPTATNTGSSGSGTSSTPQTLTFNYTKTWNNGVATITLTPTNPEATAFLGRDSAQFSTRTRGFAMTLLNN